MTADAAYTTLRRKTRASPSSVGPTAMDAPKAIRVAMARAGEEVLDTPVSVRNVDIGATLPEALTATDLSDAPIEHALLLALSDRSGAQGLAMLCPQTVAAIIEASTLGQVFPTPAEGRVPTATDAALAQGFFDVFLQAFGTLSAEISQPPPVAGYTAPHRYEDLRGAQMALADRSHKRFSVTLDFGLGSKVGQVLLLFPSQRAAAAAEARAAEAWAEHLERAVMGTQAHLTAELARLSLPLAALTSLKPGDLVPLGDASVDSVALIAPTGQRVAGARLGRAGLMRAVRVKLVEEDGDGAAVDVTALAMSGPVAGATPLSLPLATPSAGALGSPSDLMQDDPSAALPDIGAPMAELPMADGSDIAFDAMDAQPMAFDAGGIDFDPVGEGDDNMLGAIQPMQVPASEAKPG